MLMSTIPYFTFFNERYIVVLCCTFLNVHTTHKDECNEACMPLTNKKRLSHSRYILLISNDKLCSLFDLKVPCYCRSFTCLYGCSPTTHSYRSLIYFVSNVRPNSARSDFKSDRSEYKHLQCGNDPCSYSESLMVVQQHLSVRSAHSNCVQSILLP